MLVAEARSSSLFFSIFTARTSSWVIKRSFLFWIFVIADSNTTSKTMDASEARYLDVIGWDLMTLSNRARMSDIVISTLCSAFVTEFSLVNWLSRFSSRLFSNGEVKYAASAVSFSNVLKWVFSFFLSYQTYYSISWRCVVPKPMMWVSSFLPRESSFWTCP